MAIKAQANCTELSELSQYGYVSMWNTRVVDMVDYVCR